MQASIREKIMADAVRDAEKKIAEAEKRATLAEFYQSRAVDGLEPDFIHVHDGRGYLGAVGSLSFNKVAMDDALRLLEAFPPTDCGVYKDGTYTKICPVDAEGERYTLHRDADCALLELDGGHGYGQRCKLKFWHDSAAGRIEISAELEGKYVPRIYARAVEAAGHTFVRYEGTDSIVWPEFARSWNLAFVRYGRGSDSALQHFTVYDMVREFLQECAERLDRENAETREAYVRAQRELTEQPRPATAEECETCRNWYERTTLRAGSLLQTATLATPTAEAWQAVAKAHWPQFAKAHGLTRGRYGFDGYGFAVWYLERAGVLTDAGYKYGSAWL